MSITVGITIGSVSRTVKVTGLSRATVVRIVHERRPLAEGKGFPCSNKTLWYIHKEKNCLTWDRTYGFPFQAHTVEPLGDKITN